MHSEIDDIRPGISSASDTLRYLCLGKLNLQKALMARNMISDKPNKPAIKGTKIHASIAGEDVDLTYSESSLVETLRRMEAKLVEDVSLREGEEFILLDREQRLYLHKGITPIFSGQYDTAYTSLGFRKALIDDKKTGFFPVTPAERNFQLSDLGAMFGKEHPETEKLYVAIHQPMVSREPSVAVFTRQDMDDALERLQTNLVQVSDPNAPRTAGAHCTYCPCRVYCDDAETWAASPAALVDQIAAGFVSLPDGEEGAEVITLLKFGMSRAKAILDAYKAKLATEPDSVPGWFLKPGKWSRDIPNQNIDEAKDRMHDAGLPASICEKATSLSVAKMEEGYCEISELSEKKAKDRFNELMGDLIVRKQDEPSLSKRPARGKYALPEPQREEGAA